MCSVLRNALSAGKPTYDCHYLCEERITSEILMLMTKKKKTRKINLIEYENDFTELGR